MVEAEEKREGNGREVARLATGGRYLLAGRTYFRKISKFALMFMQTFYYLMLLTISIIVILLNLPGLKLQFKGQNLICFINSRNIYWAPMVYHGERNGNPFQCSCLENPRNGGAWWAAIYGFAQSWTRLKRLSSMVYQILFCKLNTLQRTKQSKIVATCSLLFRPGEPGNKYDRWF